MVAAQLPDDLFGRRFERGQCHPRCDARSLQPQYCHLSSPCWLSFAGQQFPENLSVASSATWPTRPNERDGISSNVGRRRAQAIWGHRYIAATPQPLPNTAKPAITKIIGNKKKILGPVHGFVYFSL